MAKCTHAETLARKARIISASRRTDIPAFYTHWFMNRIRAGYCHWLNPFGGQVYRVSLRPEDCTAIVFWTRNARPLLPHLPELRKRGYRFYFHCTITGYPRELDPRCPSPRAAIDVVKRLGDLIGPELVLWRYDPIIVSALTPIRFHLENFDRLSQALEGATNCCYVSFVDLYRKTERNLRSLRLGRQECAPRPPGPEEQRELLATFAQIADARGMSLHVCCDNIPAEAAPPGLVIHQARCVDPDLIRTLRPDLDLELEPRPTRPGCGCVRSVDIGAYDTCLFGCLYCYANSSLSAALARYCRHDPGDTILYRPPRLKDVNLESVARSIGREHADVQNWL